MIDKTYKEDMAYELFFTSLSSPNRLKIINQLREKKMNVTQICQATGFEQTMVSHNLKRLQRCGMVFSERAGKFKYFSVNRKTIKPLLNLIDNHMRTYCCKIIGLKDSKDD